MAYIIRRKYVLRGVDTYQALIERSFESIICHTQLTVYFVLPEIGILKK